MNYVVEDHILKSETIYVRMDKEIFWSPAAALGLVLMDLLLTAGEIFHHYIYCSKLRIQIIIENTVQ